MDTIGARSQAGLTQEFTPEYVDRMIRGLALMAGWSGMENIYKNLMSTFVRDLRRATQPGQPFAPVMDAFLTVFSGNSGAAPYLCAAIDAAVDFNNPPITAHYNLCLLRIYFDAVAGDEPRAMIYIDRFDYPDSWQTTLNLRLGHAERVIRAGPCRDTLESQLWDAANATQFMAEQLAELELERSESETDHESPEILHDMKREHDPAVVQAAMKSGAAKNVYQAVARAQLTREYLVVTLAKKATAWRVRDNKVGRGGIVVFPPVDSTRPAGIDRLEVAGWSNELRNPERWVPGCLAVNEAGECWEARGGDEQHGADAWVSMRAPC